MSLIEQILLAVALAMDCFTVSVATGLLKRRIDMGQMFVMSLLFGLFQALMPLTGWLLTQNFESYIKSFDHWIAFSLLLFVGGKMVLDHFKEEEESSFNPDRLTVMLLLAVATSIDALAVGISFVCVGMTTLTDVVWPVLIIGAGSLLFSILGQYIGVYVGRRFNLPVELMGGLILIGIGIKILLEHLS